jgi:hypothetical protein
MSEIHIAAHRSPGFNIAIQTDHELEARLNRLMSGLASLAPYGPMFGTSAQSSCYLSGYLILANLFFIRALLCGCAHGL